MKEVSIVIPTRFNNRWMLDLNLRCIRKYTDYPYRIIIGDAGMDKEAKVFLEKQGDVTVTQCPDSIRPKDHLARFVQTPYFIFLHDDAQILKKGWLKKRVNIMESNPKNAIIGTLGNNYKYGWQRFFKLSSVWKRFFPFALMVKKEVQDEMDLIWGKIKGFDTGGVAYQQFQIQKRKKWKFIHYPFKNDIKHWGGMTWIMRKKITGEKAYTDIDPLVNIRNEKISLIKKIIEEGDY